MVKELYFAGGCFWGVEHYFSCIYGVVTTQVGYCNGATPSPSYEQVCREGTGHAEAVQVLFDTQRLSLPYLLRLFYKIIDPTAVNRQGHDIGKQYRTGIYFVEDEDRAAIEASLKELQKKYSAPLAIEVELLREFYPAEEYHQDYLKKNPNGYCHISFKTLDEVKRLPYQKQEPRKLKQQLTEEQWRVTQDSQTERPFQNAYYDTFEPGIYVDITTGAPLFLSTDKFDSGCGWPSFLRPLEEGGVYEREDNSHFMHRTEVRSTVGDAHLGHVFTDGPQASGGLRYCINSASLRFVPEKEMKAQGYAKYLPLLNRNAK